MRAFIFNFSFFSWINYFLFIRRYVLGFVVIIFFPNTGNVEVLTIFGNLEWIPTIVGDGI